MHRKTEHYLDEICFWHCARTRLLQRTAQLQRQGWHPPMPVAADTPLPALDELLRKCGLEHLCRCSTPAHERMPGPWRRTPPGPGDGWE